MINNIVANKIVVSNKLSFKKSFKYFICYKDPEKIKPLCIFHPHMIIYKKSFYQNRCIYFLIKKEKVFIKYMDILENVRNIIKNKFNSEFLYSKKYLKTEKHTHTHTHNGGFQCLYAPVILIDSIYRKDENCYPKVFLEKYYFIEDIEIYYSNYCDDRCINLFLKSVKKQEFFFSLSL